jgi:hypothetical protein
VADWDESVGPFLDTAGVLTLTGLAESELIGIIVSRKVLVTTTSDGWALFPNFQFGPKGELLPGLPELVTLLAPISDDAWDIALWLRTTSDDFGGVSAAELLHAGEVERVLAVARRDGRRLGR